MRKSKQETAATRARIVATAATEFRRHGIEGTGLADLMAAAGLTHGGFYRHFDSKQQLVSDACAAALTTTAESLASAAEGKSKRKGAAGDRGEIPVHGASGPSASRLRIRGDWQ